MSTPIPSFDDYREGFRARALQRMEAFEKVVEKAHAETVKAAQQSQANKGHRASQHHPVRRTQSTPPPSHTPRRLVNKGW